MASLTNLTSTAPRPSLARSPFGAGTVDSSSDQALSNFSSLLAALFAAPPVIVPTQTAVPTSLVGGGTATGGSSGNPAATDGIGNGLASSVASQLFAATLTNITNPASGLTGTTVQVGQALANAVNTILGQSATLPGQTTSAGSPLIAGLSAVAGQALNSAATSLTQSGSTALSAIGQSITSALTQTALTQTASGAQSNSTQTAAVPISETTATVASSLLGTSTTTSASFKASIKAVDKLSAGEVAKALLLDAVTNQAATNSVLALPAIGVVDTQPTRQTTVSPTLGSVTPIGLPSTSAIGQTKLNGSIAASGALASTLTTTATPTAFLATLAVGLPSSVATAIDVPDATTTSQVSASLSTSLVNSGRTSVQAVLVPALSQTPLGQPSSADANPTPFFSFTGLDRPADAVTNLDVLGVVGTNSGSTAVFARERSDIADLNSLLRPRAGNANATDSANLQTAAGLNFGKLVESSVSTATTPAADQSGRVLNQIANAVAERAQVIREKGETEIRMRLDPPEMGTIDIRVHTLKGELRAEITAADPAVRAMIESHLADLRSSLEKSGLDFQSFNLSSGHRSDRGGQPDNPGEFAGFARRTPLVPAVVAQTPGAVNPNRGALLDVTA